MTTIPADALHGPPDGPLLAVCLRINDLRPTVDPLDGSVGRDGRHPWWKTTPWPPSG